MITHPFDPNNPGVGRLTLEAGDSIAVTSGTVHVIIVRDDDPHYTLTTGDSR